MKRKLYYFLAFLLLLVNNKTMLYAAPAEKTVEFEIEKDYEACTFQITVQNEGNYEVNVYNKSDKDKKYIEQIAEGTSCTVSVKDVKNGIWCTDVKEILPEEYDLDEERNADEYIGKIQVNVKAIDSTAFTLDQISVARDIAGLNYYFKDDNIIVEWTDVNCGNVVINVINTQNSQILDKQTVSGQYYEYKIPDNIEEISLEIVPATSSSIAGADIQVTLSTVNNPDASVNFESAQYTNKEVSDISIVSNGDYKVQVFDNESEKVASRDLQKGENIISVPIVEGSNTIEVDIMDKQTGNIKTYSNTIIRDSIKPELSLEMDYEGAATYNEVVYFNGVVKDFETFTINETTPTVAGDGVFSAEYTLHDGDNKIIMTATDKAGNVTVYEATVHKLVREQKFTQEDIIRYCICGAIIIYSLTIFLRSMKDLRKHGTMKTKGKGNKNGRRKEN